jgi:hypothetical protein
MNTHVETLGLLQSKLEFSKSFGLDYITLKMGTLIDYNFVSFFRENRNLCTREWARFGEFWLLATLCLSVSLGG